MFNKNKTEDKLSKFRKMSLKQPMLFAAVADIMVQNGDFKSAKKVLNKGLHQFPKYSTAWIVKGNLHLLINEKENALSAFSKVVECESNVTYALRKCVELTEDLGDKTNCMKYLNSLCEADPLDTNAQTMLQTYKMREIAIENKLYTQEEVGMLMPNTLRQILIQKNLIPMDLERKSPRVWQTKPADRLSESTEVTNDIADGGVAEELIDLDEYEEVKVKSDAHQLINDPLDDEVESVTPRRIKDLLPETKPSEHNFELSEDWLGAEPSHFDKDSNDVFDEFSEDTKHSKISWADVSAGSKESTYLDAHTEEFDGFTDDNEINESGDDWEKLPHEIGYDEENNEANFDAVIEADQNSIEDLVDETQADKGFYTPPEQFDPSKVSDKWRKLLEPEPQQNANEPIDDNNETTSSFIVQDTITDFPPKVKNIELEDFHDIVSQTEDLNDVPKKETTTIHNDEVANEKPARPKLRGLRESLDIYKTQEQVSESKQSEESANIEKEEEEVEQPHLRKSSGQDAIKRLLEDSIKRKSGAQIERGMPENSFTSRESSETPTTKTKFAITSAIDEITENTGASQIEKPKPSPIFTPKKDISDETKNQLGQVAQEVTGKKPDPKKVAPPPIAADGPKKVVTKTLAELYASQGDITRAVEVYELLLEKHPTNEAYKARIKDLKDRLKG